MQLHHSEAATVGCRPKTCCRILSPTWICRGAGITHLMQHARAIAGAHGRHSAGVRCRLGSGAHRDWTESNRWYVRPWAPALSHTVIWDMGYSGCSRQFYTLPSPMWDRQSPPRAHTRIRLSHRLPCDHSSLHLYHLPRLARFPAV
jgi:hypothetical protein